MAKIRADQLLVDQGLAPNKSRAQALILAGEVYWDTRRIEKAGDLLSGDAELRVKGEQLRYVSRGGIKLEGALDAFAIEVTGFRCLDLGASTGGFTDCLLQRGATEILAVDVGYGQLHQKLRADPRVVVMERTNGKTLTPEILGGAVDLTVVDASFIGIEKLMDAIALCTRGGGHLLGLIKPQFEVGQKEASRGKGVVRDPEIRQAAIHKASEAVGTYGFEVLGVKDCVLAGPKGNLEAFVYARRLS